MNSRSVLFLLAIVWCVSFLPVPTLTAEPDSNLAEHPLYANYSLPRELSRWVFERKADTKAMTENPAEGRELTLVFTRPVHCSTSQAGRLSMRSSRSIIPPPTFNPCSTIISAIAEKSY
ncbi:MAG: hypothetical protein ACOZF0_15625 [Thermodesulfobacteriota bacterium]